MRLERVIRRDSGCSVGLRLRRITDVRNAQVDVATLKGLQIWLSIIGDCRRTKGGWVEGRVAVCVILLKWCARADRIAWRRNTRLIERQRNDLVASDRYFRAGAGRTRAVAGAEIRRHDQCRLAGGSTALPAAAVR